MVYWRGAQGSPPITNYVISGGPGSCPVIVGPNARRALLPALSKEAMTVTVEAVNSYGFSPSTASTGTITANSLASSDLKNVQLLQFSDFHGALEASSTAIGAAGLAAAFEADRKLSKATLTLSSGDNIGAAPPISSQFGELPTIRALNGMRLDVSTFGNHEHDRATQHLREMIRYSDFKWIVSNYSSLKGLKASNDKRAQSYTIIDRGGVKVGVIGINTSQTVDQVFPGNLDFTYAGVSSEIVIQTGVVKAQRAVDAATAAGADLVVALIHEGWNQNLGGEALGPLIGFAEDLKGVAAVYGGHSHQQFSSVVNGVTTAMVKNSGVQYTRTQLCVDTKANKVLGSSVEFIGKSDVASLTPNAAVTTMVGGYKSRLNAKMDVQIGSVADLSPRGGRPAVERSGEAALGSYTADLVRAKYEVDLALLNGGGIRDTLPAGNYKPADATLRRPAGTQTVGPFDVTLGDAYTVFPFGNSISTAQISGAGLWAALENGVSNYPTDGRFPQVSGFKFSFDSTKAVGSRIVSVTKTDGTLIPKDTASYSIATLDFLVYGGDGYSQFNPANQQVRDLLVDVFTEGLKADLAAGKVTTLKTDGRITVIK
jgi:5'-nucleotidase